MEPQFLTLEEVLEIHRDQIARHGGAVGLRDMGLLQSAVAMPSAGFGDTYFHSDIFEMAAAYLFHIVGNHPFIDGNKRTGTAACLMFLRMNDVGIDYDQDSLGDLTLAVAEGRMQKPEVAAFLRERPRTSG